MPPRADIRSILLIGSGPIRIGQGCEFDYSGVQACRALRSSGYRVILVNSNPATIMTDPGWADATYLEPLDCEAVAEIIRRERPDALLSTLGGQTGLNVSLELAEAGVLDEFGVELIGADLGAIFLAEDRRAFRDSMAAAGLNVLSSVAIDSLSELPTGLAPAVVRPAFTLGGSGGGLALTEEELRRQVEIGLHASPVNEVLVERSVAGWQEFELEVVVDGAGSCIVVCSIENIDPMGIHTGDSWTVAPQQTLPDSEYQRLREAAFLCVRTVGVATGGANVQFAYEPSTRELAVIEMNPRVSRSSALASKATGFPIAKMAALLAVGFTLEELPNDITGKTTAAFEPALDYVAVKAPRFDFDKFDVSDRTLGTQMQSIGEALGLGRTFPEALLKALEGLEDRPTLPDFDGCHPYFKAELESIAQAERRLRAYGDVDAAKRFGLPDARIARVLEVDEREVRRRRRRPGRLSVDSCAAEFEATSSYFYLSYERSDHREKTSDRPAVVILGSGPNRIGQGIEFDYCCVQAVQAFQKLGYDAVMVNSNPETVSTDYDTSDRLYLEPLTLERVLDICEIERPIGVVVSFGGQTPLRLAHDLAAEGIPLLGEPLSAIDAAEDRGRFAALIASLDLAVPGWGVADNEEQALSVAERVGYPVLVRPHYVLGGRGMRIVRSPQEMSLLGPSLVDHFIEDGLELDVDVLGDGTSAWVAGILEQVEPTGSHSGDSACLFPAPSVDRELAERISLLSSNVASALGVQGLMNLQLAVKDGEIYVLEANPRASRTVPFVSKALGVSLVELACRLMLGASVDELELPASTRPNRAWAKEAVFPTDRFPGSDRRGPEMLSTGEVMASGATAAEAYQRALRAARGVSAPGPIGPTLQELAMSPPPAQSCLRFNVDHPSFGVMRLRQPFTTEPSGTEAC